MITEFGGKIADNEPVINIESSDNIVEVTTRKNTYRSRSLIITAGAWAPKLLKHIGLDLPLWVSTSTGQSIIIFKSKQNQTIIVSAEADEVNTSSCQQASVERPLLPT